MNRDIHVRLSCFMLILVYDQNLCSSESSYTDYYKWEPYGSNLTSFKSPLKLSAPNASSLIDEQPVYISIATISDRIGKVHETIEGILSNDLLPTHIYVFISHEPFLLDKGVHEDTIPLALQILTKTMPVSIIYTDNIGPHRKLLPILARFWHEDCVIITIDDDKGRGLSKITISQLIKYYLASNKKSIVALRARRIGICSKKPWKKTGPYLKWPGATKEKHEMLVLPTGTGGVLYRPRFLHPIIFDLKLREYTISGDDLAFRLAGLAAKTYVMIGCREERNKGSKQLYNKCPKIVQTVDVRGGRNTFSPISASDTMNKEWTKKEMKGNDVGDGSDDETEYSLPSVANGRQASIALKLDVPEIMLNNSNISFVDIKSQQIDEHRRLGLFGMNRAENDKMWSKAVRYLKQRKVLDLAQVLLEYAELERQNCDSKVRACGFIRCR